MRKKTLLSTLWTVLTVNFLFCDIFTLMHAPDLQNFLQGRVDDLVMNQEFLLGFAIVMEIPMLMILLSRLLPDRSNRLLQIAAALLLLVLQLWSLTVGAATLHYVFFSLVEIGLLLAILWQGIRWMPDRA